MAPGPDLHLLFKSHPWHGVGIGPEAPRRVTVFVKIVPSDTIKYELDKDSGLLKVDRPQLYSNVCPSPYGFVPQTLRATAVAGLAGRA
jgi:inorganic pyrophosphatase